MPHATRPGDVLGDRYRLVDLLTESGGGRFWRAYDQVLERHVAIHVIRGDDERAPALMEAARRSATVAERRVLRVLDADRRPEQCYVVNEWGWGTSLDIVVAGSGPLGPRRASWLVAEAADALAAAHAMGVAHGRLNPENVLVDRAGGIRLIGLGVDAALHGIDLPAEEAIERDVEDLAGLLYCALTTRWAGGSGSMVPAAPREHGVLLRPRQVRAGVPRPLDQLCEDVLHQTTGPAATGGRHRGAVEPPPTTAREIADQLTGFVGDPTGMPAALLASTPDVLPEAEQVVLPPVPEPAPHPEPEAEPEPEPEPVVEAAPEPPPVTDVDEDRPTQAGVPIFGDDDVSWLERRTTPAPPPPPFEVPPERPLFAPAPTGGAASRTPRQPASGDRREGGRGDEFWPWDTGTGAATGSRAMPAVPYASDTDADEGPGRRLPGRTFARVGIVLAALVLIAVAVVVALNLGGGDGTEAGGESTSTDDPGRPGRQGRTEARGLALTGLAATAFDPQGDPPSENDADAGLAVDGDPATSWSTQGYEDQLGPPPGLKDGVGLVLDLGGAQAVEQAVLSFVGTPTSASLFLTDGPPESLAGLEPVVQGSADGARLALDLDGARGSHLVVWLTALPLDDDGLFRGTVSEVVVRGGDG